MEGDSYRPHQRQEKLNEKSWSSIGFDQNNRRPVLPLARFEVVPFYTGIGCPPGTGIPVIPGPFETGASSPRF